MKKILPIVYHGGSYGTYLNWCLARLMTNNTIQDPFTTVGNSHLFEDGIVKDMAGWRRFVASSHDMAVGRLHVKTHKDDSIIDNINEVLNDCDRLIFIYPDRDSKLLCINNYYQKVWDDWWESQFARGYIDKEKIYNNWPVDPSTPIKDIPIWIRREFLSYYLMPAWYSQVEWFLPDCWHDDRCLVVYMKDILYDIETTLEKIKEFGNLNFVCSVSSLQESHNKMMSLQANLDQDRICKEICHAIINQQDLDWSQQYLPLASQSWIQWQLRTQGWEIQCHELNDFPSNTQAMLSKLETIKN